MDRKKSIDMQKKLKWPSKKNRSLQMWFNNMKEELSKQLCLMSKLTEMDLGKISKNQRTVL